MLAHLFFSSFFLTLSLLSLLFVSFSLYQKLHRPEPVPHPAAKEGCPEAESDGLSGEPDPELDPGQGQGRRRKKKAKKKSKRSDLDKEQDQSVVGCDAKKVEKSGSGPDSGSLDKPELICLYPFTSSGSATQRRIKQQYDELVKSHESKGLTLAQVGQFANCLVEARNDLQHKSEVIHRKFMIAKALLCKADRSSFDRVRQQIYKLELEQKRLEEDAFVYNWLQQQLKLSPAYKKDEFPMENISKEPLSGDAIMEMMLEISASVELKSKSCELLESKDADLPDISFEELLAQEKKDSFWQKLGKSRSCSG